MINLTQKNSFQQTFTCLFAGFLLLLNCSVQSYIDDRFGLGGIDKLDRTSRKDKAVAIQDDVAAIEIDATEEDGLSRSAAHL